jgi:CheY-like chemotaxis protein/glycine cleavage system H lipoate-binding protein
MTTTAVIFIVAGIILFFFLNLAARELHQKLQEIKRQTEREEALAEYLKLDFTRESKTLKRVEVSEPKARILCVDDEEIILDTFRKILVLDGYCIDTVETGQEALGLVQTRNYDFVFTDLKMPAMPGTEVAKGVKHLRPDIDVIIITGYASVESAVECMKYGAMDYVEKPFTEDELRAFVKQALIRRQDRIEKQSKPRVKIMGPEAAEPDLGGEFSIPGGALISTGHCWASIAEDGTAKIGIDDFARKLLGHVDGIGFPAVGMKVKAGQPLFSVNQGNRKAQFNAPLSGTVQKINEHLQRDSRLLDEMPYGENWVCVIDGDGLDEELPALKIGNSAITFFQEDIERFKAFVRDDRADEDLDPAALYTGAIGKMDDMHWDRAVKEFFGR